MLQNGEPAVTTGQTLELTRVIVPAGELIAALQTIATGERYAEAMTWFMKAAEQGNASAQNTIGLIHSKGLGVPKDPVTAYMWYHISATTDPGGYGVVARKNIGIISKTMTPAQIADARARARPGFASCTGTGAPPGARAARRALAPAGTKSLIRKWTTRPPVTRKMK